MGEIRFVGTGETRGYPYPVCKKRIVRPGKRRGYPYPVCKKNIITVCNICNVTFTFKYDFLFLSLSSSHSVVE